MFQKIFYYKFHTLHFNAVLKALQEIKETLEDIRDVAVESRTAKNPRDKSSSSFILS